MLQALKLYVLYHLDDELLKNQVYPYLTAVDIHKRLGHISHKDLKYLLEHGMIQGIKLDCIGEKVTSVIMSAESSVEKGRLKQLQGVYSLTRTIGKGTNLPLPPKLLEGLWPAKQYLTG